MGIAAGLLGVTTLLALTESNASAASSNKALILAGTVTGGSSSIEASEAAAKGLAVDVVDAATWSSMTASQFASYRAIILGDPTCAGPGTTPDVDAAAANAHVWGPILNGNIVILGTDPVYHASQGGETVTRRGVDFAVNQVGKTGAYITLSCYYHNTASNTPIPLLDGIGSGGFTVTGVGCYNDSHIVAASPALAGLTDTDLSNWSCSVHEAFRTWPGGLIPLAIAKDFDSSFTASDGTRGPPYILAGGDIRSFPLSLSPLSASAPAGGTHTVTAQLLDGATSMPFSGAKIGFRISAGPNAGASGSCNPSNCLTTTAGIVSFNYTSNGTVGTDTISAFYDQNGNGLADVGEPQTTAGIEWTHPINPACQGIFLVGARGSGEKNNDYGGYGRTVATAVSAFRNHLGSGYKVEAHYLDYPSRSIDLLYNPIKLLQQGVYSFLDGVDDGTDTLVAILERNELSCPGRQVALFGYSQGALVVEEALRLLNVERSPIVEHVVGIGLIADPQRLGTSSYTVGSAKSNFNGIARTVGVYPADDLPLAVQPKTVSWCTDGDMVCAFNTGLLLTPPAVVNWVRAILNTKQIHGSYWQSASQAVGDLVADKVKSP